MSNTTGFSGFCSLCGGVQLIVLTMKLLENHTFNAVDILYSDSLII